jgi:predicted amidohydrolase YtcJ
MSAVADVLLTGGKIWLGQKEGFAEALAIKGETVLACGSATEMAALAGPSTAIIDLEGRLATPGLYDVHTHLAHFGLGLKNLDLNPRKITSVSALLDEVAAAVKTRAPGEWVIGRGYDHSKLSENRHPTRQELDAIAPDNPVYVVRACGHVGVANSVALTLGGITYETPDPDGGAIGRADGELTGLLAENARAPVASKQPVPDLDDYIEAIEAGGRMMLSYGITSTMDAAVGMSNGWTEFAAYETAKATGRLPVRVSMCLIGDKERNILEEATEKGYVAGSGDDMLRVRQVKIFIDGSIGGKTAAMKTPYEGTDGDHGLFCLTQDETDALVKRAHDLGYQMAVHAIGDAAIERILNAFRAAQEANPAPDRRHRIEHCGWLSHEQIATMVELGALPAPQPDFIYYFGDQYVEVRGKEASDFAYPMRTWIDAGLRPSASTDCPVTPLNPFAGLYAMVTRTTDKGTVLGADQALTMEEALNAYTLESAYASHEEKIKGRLVPGQLADIAVFSQDLFDIAPSEILNTTCDMTLLGGKVVFQK